MLLEKVDKKMNGMGKREEKGNEKMSCRLWQASKEELGMKKPDNYASETLIKSIPEKDKVTELMERREL